MFHKTHYSSQVQTRFFLIPEASTSSLYPPLPGDLGGRGGFIQVLSVGNISARYIQREGHPGFSSQSLRQPHHHHSGTQVRDQGNRQRGPLLVAWWVTDL